LHEAKIERLLLILYAGRRSAGGQGAARLSISTELWLTKSALLSVTIGLQDYAMIYVVATPK
jgi:hypothetical protein